MLKFQLLVFTVLIVGPLLTLFAQDHGKTLFPVVQDGRCGYIDRNGALTIQPRFDHCWEFSEGLACIVIKGKTGFIDESGEMIIEPRFNSLYGCYAEFSNGRANVSIGNGGKETWGFVNRNGEFNVVPGSSFVSNFREGLAFFKIDGKTGYFDQNLNIAIKPRFKSAGNFYDGRARVTDLEGSKYYIDKNGQKLFTNNDGSEFQDGKAFFVIKKKYGFIDTAGKIIVEAKFEKANQFGEGLAGVKVGDNWGFIDESGRIVIEPQFEEVGVFSEGLVNFATGDKWGFADKSGRIVIPPQFDKFTYFFEGGLCEIRVDGKIGYVDTSGRFVWPPSK